ncbi:MAG: VWA domain-containing protein, partial [Mailhella sp.]|nr:VWA domain-containing protein [Mailhella sp.]
MTADEISLKLGTSTAVINRYLRLNGGYSPSLDMIPRLCSVLDNIVLLDWLKAQVESPKAVPQAKDSADVLMAVANASAALGDVSRLLVRIDKTGINAGLAKKIRSALEEVKNACSTAQDQIQDIAASDISQHVVLNHICLRDQSERLEFSQNRRLDSSSDLLFENMNNSGFQNKYQEDFGMTAIGNSFPYGHIENDQFRNQKASLKSVHVSGEIRGLLFTYNIRQEYKNDTEEPLEVIYTFPIAWNTALLGMTASINGNALTAQVVEKKDAESRYEEAVSDGDSAIMVQKSAKGLYTANLGNIASGESVIIELHCAQLLCIEHGRIRICVPTVISERYGNGHIQSGLAAHESVTTSRNAQYDFGASITVMGDMATRSVICPSHGIKGQAADGGLQFSIDGNAHLDRDFVLLIEGVSGMTFAQSSTKCDEIMLAASFTPILPQNVHSALGLKILVDCSGSMEGKRMQQAVRGLEEVLLQLSPQDFVSYSMFGSDVRHTFRSMHPCSPDTLKKLTAHIASTDADMGGTEMEHALASTFALALPKGSEAV